MTPRRKLLMLDTHFDQMLDSPAVVECVIPLTPTNPQSEEIRKRT
jgi:hypothetical protein